MSFRLFLIIIAIVSGLFGLGLLLAPTLVMGGIYGLSLEASGQFIARVLGGTFLALGVIYWWGRDTATDLPLMRGVSIGSIVFSVCGFCLATYAVITGLMNPLGWTIPLLHLLWLAGFALLGFRRAA